MDESEKMTTLKKVYADIILNTAKEAAARIMISERKALRFQQEIFTVKDEALSMLVRLKQMMDSKISEAEITALSQRKRTEELEAQLHQAEGIVRDLRTELKGLQDEMKKAKHNPVRPLDEHVRASSGSHEDALQHNKVKTSESIDALLNQRHANAHCRLVQENSTAQRERRSVSSENCFAGNSDLASIIMRSKEPELYRNGCTQRVRAFERNLLKESDNSDIGAAERTCTSFRPKDDDMRSTGKNSTNLDNLLQKESSLIKEQAAMLPIFSTRKRRSHRRTSSCNEHDTKACEPSNLSRCNTFPCLVDSIAESGEDFSRTIEGAQRKLDSHLIPVSSLNSTDVNLGSDHKDSSGSHAEVTKSEMIQLAAEDTKLIDESVLTKQETRVAESSDVQLCESKKEDSKSEMTNGTPAPMVNDRFLKYTFQRKRKRESLSIPGNNALLSIPDNNALLEKKSMSKTMSEENQSSAPEPNKSSLLTESSRESRRLMQVARQLISLSEKKW